MHWLAVVGLSWLALGAALVLGFLTGLPWAAALLIASAGWAGFDSRRLRFREHRHCEAFHPVVLTAAIGGLLWPVTFPWYLVMRRRIRAGVLPRERPFHPDGVVF
jgi:hypothetical protein